MHPADNLNIQTPIKSRDQGVSMSRLADLELASEQYSRDKFIMFSLSRNLCWTHIPAGLVASTNCDIAG